MKKLLLSAAILAFAAPAMASKARMISLGLTNSNSPVFVVDTQSVFDNPSHLLSLNNFATYEMGATSNLTPTAVAGQSPDAEGGVVQTYGSSKYGVYFGRKSDFTTASRYYLGFKGQENPLELQYASKINGMDFGASLNYSSSDKKSSLAQKQTAAGARFGLNTDQWEAYAVIGLGSSASGSTASNFPIDDYNGNGSYGAGEIVSVVADANSELKGTTGFKLGGGYKMDHLYSYATYYQDGAEYTSPLNTTLSGMTLAQSQLDLGIVDHNKLDAGMWYYGIAGRMFKYARTNVKNTKDRTTDTLSLPFMLGIETKANSVVTVRASVTQNVLLGSTKQDDGTGTHAGLAGDLVDDEDTIVNNTVASLGTGIQLGKWNLDGVMAASTTGQINTTNFMTNASLTYNF